MTLNQKAYFVALFTGILLLIIISCQSYNHEKRIDEIFNQYEADRIEAGLEIKP